MIKKTAVAAALLFLAYTAFVAIVRPAGIFQNQWQSNIIKAQDYIYGDRGHRRVIVGSSLAASAFTLNTPDGYFDLSFAGGSPLDGLEIIRRSGILPESLLIETNFYDRNSTLAIDKTVFVPLLTDIRRRVPSLQERYQPMNIVLPGLFDLMRAVKKAVAGPADVSGHEGRRAPETRIGSGGRMMQAPQAAGPGLPVSSEEKTRIEKKLGEMAGYIDYFRKNNVTIIFFEMPVHENAFFSPQAVYRRETLRKAFSGQECFYLPTPACGGLTYGDGAHLDQAGALAYREHFAAEADKIYEGLRRRR